MARDTLVHMWTPGDRVRFSGGCGPDWEGEVYDRRRLPTLYNKDQQVDQHPAPAGVVFVVTMRDDEGHPVLIRWARPEQLELVSPVSKTRRRDGIR